MRKTRFHLSYINQYCDCWCLGKARSQGISNRGFKNIPVSVVFGLGRIFRLERSAFHDRVSSAARAWGHKFSSEAMGENRFSLWSYHIGTVFESIQLSFDIYRVSNHHLVHDIHQMVGGLHNLYKFQWSITSCLSYIEYWPEDIKTCLPPCGG